MRDQLTVMRRANGELFTLTVKGRKHLALWPSLESAERYKYRNPDLLVFKPASVASSFGQKSLRPLKEDGVELFLLVDAGGAHFGDGRKISWDEFEGSFAADHSHPIL